MSLLPGQILPQSVPLGRVDQAGRLLIDHNWYLFLYNLALQVLSGQSGGALPTSQADLIDMVDLDAEGADVPQAYRGLANLTALQDIDLPPMAPTLRDLANAILLALEEPLAASSPQAQPVQTVAVGASPFTFTALENGTLFLSGNTAESITITRQGTTFTSGAAVGPIPLRRLDQVTITYLSAPTAVFLGA